MQTLLGAYKHAPAAVARRRRPYRPSSDAVIAYADDGIPLIAIVTYYLYTIVEKFSILVMPGHRNAPPRSKKRYAFFLYVGSKNSVLLLSQV